MAKKVWYEVAFRLEVELDDDDPPEVFEDSVAESVMSLIDEELMGHRDGQTRCGNRFSDATSVAAKVTR